jgi:hypothetical protein
MKTDNARFRNCRMEPGILEPEKSNLKPQTISNGYRITIE